MSEVLSPDRADLVGHLAGFDFSASPAVRNLAGSPDFGKLAATYLAQYFRGAAEHRPAVILLDELHWADDGSLDAIEHLLGALADVRLLIVGLTRPTLFERRKHWAEGRRGVGRLDLKPLSRRGQPRAGRPDPAKG